MKQLSIKQLLLIASITLCMPTLCMMNTLREYADRFKTWSYKTFFEKPSVYNTGTQAIDTTASNLSTAAVRLSPYMFPFRNLTPDQKKNRLLLQKQMIDRRLKQIENNLKQDEKNTINELFTYYGLTTDQRQAITSKIDEIKQFEKKYMSRPHKKTVGNTEPQPEHIYIYKTAGFHPQGIKLTRSDDSSGLWGRSLGIEIGPPTNPSKQLAVISPPEIKLSTPPGSLLEIGTFAHEVGHHASHHNTTTKLLEKGLSAFTGKTPEEINNNRIFQKLLTIHEQQAEILHKNAALADIMRNYRKFIGYYPDQLYLGHYGKLAEIAELYELRKKLENYKPEPAQPKIDTLNTMKFNAPGLPLQSQPHQSPQKPKVPRVDQISADAQQQETE